MFPNACSSSFDMHEGKWALSFHHVPRKPKKSSFLIPGLDTNPFPVPTCIQVLLVPHLSPALAPFGLLGMQGQPKHSERSSSAARSQDTDTHATPLRPSKWRFENRRRSSRSLGRRPAWSCRCGRLGGLSCWSKVWGLCC